MPSNDEDFFCFLLSIAWRLPSWNRRVLDVKALIYLPHSCVIFVAIVSIFLSDDRWSVPRPYCKPKSWCIGGSSWKFKVLLWFFFFLLLNSPFCICDIKQTMKRSSWRFNKQGERPTFLGGEVLAPLFVRVDCGCSQVCLLVIAPDFRIPPPQIFLFCFAELCLSFWNCKWTQ